ncbi:MAG: hypothetical protein Q4G67_12195 [Actinomycetia bacterium]|nr:hypothetical protein [Actinomycetes bacterium]
MASPTRDRIVEVLRADLPVTHVTRRSGRPYTLVLTKTAGLFAQAAEARRQAEADLAYLMGVDWVEV